MTARGPLRISVRRATDADTAAVLDFTRGTWGGRDYLADVWDTWLRARDGVLLAADAIEDGAGEASRPIAVARIAMLTADEAWMEGLRVDPAVRGRGAATGLQVAELAWAQAQGATTVRYATGEMNLTALRLGARHDFAPAGRWRALRPWDREPVPPDRTTMTAPSREEILMRLQDAGIALPTGRPERSPRRRDARRRRLAGDATFLRSGQLYEWRAWAWQALSADRLDRHEARGELMEAAAGASWALGLLAHERLPGQTRVVLLGGEVQPALRIVEAVSAAAGRPPALRLPDPSPLLHEIAPRLRGAGWAIGEQAVVLMARSLVDEAGSPLPLPEDGADRVEFAESPRPLGLVPGD